MSAAKLILQPARILTNYSGQLEVAPEEIVNSAAAEFNYIY